MKVVYISMASATSSGTICLNDNSKARSTLQLVVMKNIPHECFTKFRDIDIWLKKKISTFSFPQLQRKKNKPLSQIHLCSVRCWYTYIIIYAMYIPPLRTTNWDWPDKRTSRTTTPEFIHYLLTANNEYVNNEFGSRHLAYIPAVPHCRHAFKNTDRTLRAWYCP